MTTLKLKGVKPCQRIFNLVGRRQRPIAVQYPSGQRIVIIPEGYSRENIPSSDGVDVVDREGRIVSAFFPQDPAYDLFFCGSTSGAKA